MRLAHSQQDWVVGHQDEVWFSRLATPHLHAWTADKAMLLQLKTAPHRDPAPKALACYGLWREDSCEMMLRFVEKRPVSRVTTQFLHWLVTVLGEQRQKSAADVLGQCELACESAGDTMAQSPQSSRQGRRRLPFAGVPLAGEKPLAQSH